VNSNNKPYVKKKVPPGPRVRMDFGGDEIRDMQNVIKKKKQGGQVPMVPVDQLDKRLRRKKHRPWQRRRWYTARARGVYRLAAGILAGLCPMPGSNAKVQWLPPSPLWQEKPPTQASWWVVGMRQAWRQTMRRREYSNSQLVWGRMAKAESEWRGK
jgi:hypothetical protein